MHCRNIKCTWSFTLFWWKLSIWAVISILHQANHSIMDTDTEMLQVISRDLDAILPSFKELFKVNKSYCPSRPENWQTDSLKCLPKAKLPPRVSSLTLSLLKFRQKVFIFLTDILGNAHGVIINGGQFTIQNLPDNSNSHAQCVSQPVSHFQATGVYLHLQQDKIVQRLNCLIIAVVLFWSAGHTWCPSTYFEE